VILGGGVPLIGPQEKLRYPSGYRDTSRSLLRSQGGRRSKDFRGLYQQTNKQTQQARVRRRKTPRAGTGDCVGWFRFHHWSTLIKWQQSFHAWQFLEKNCSQLQIFMNYCQPNRDKRPSIWIWVQLLKNLVISTPNIDFLYQRIVQSWFDSSPPPPHIRLDKE